MQMEIRLVEGLPCLCLCDSWEDGIARKDLLRTTMPVHPINATFAMIVLPVSPE